MEPLFTLAAVAAFGSLSGIAGYFLMRRKYLLELSVGKGRETELARRAYEAAILQEINDRIGYSLDAQKIIEIISGSVGTLLPYSTVSHIVIPRGDGKILLEVRVNETVSPKFVNAVKTKLLGALGELQKNPVVDLDVDERISGKILDEGAHSSVGSFFNLPIVISQKVVGIINVASAKSGLYRPEEVALLLRITQQACQAVSRFEEVLENEKGRLVQAVESLGDGILMVDTTYHVILANKKLRQILNVGENPKIFDIVSALSGRFDLRTRMEETLQRGGVLPVEEVALGEKILQIYTSAVVDRRTGRPIGVAVLFQDITSERSLEKLRQDFTAMMVHELRSPLTTIKSTVELLVGDLDKVTKEELKKYFETIESTSQSMLELVNDLLDAAKLESGKFEAVCEAGDLAQVVADRVESFKPWAKEKDLKLELEIAKDLPQARFDKIRTRQVLGNIISNALKYTDSGAIKVRAVPELINGVPVDILVSVSDTGIGIDSDNIGKLFARFGQLSAGMRRTGSKSSGLGLFIAKGIVQAQGGKIWAESKGEGLGSTFYFTVPLAGGKIRKERADKWLTSSLSRTT